MSAHRARACAGVRPRLLPPGHVLEVERRGRFWIARCVKCDSSNAKRHLSDALAFPHNEGDAHTWHRMIA